MARGTKCDQKWWGGYDWHSWSDEHQELNYILPASHCYGPASLSLLPPPLPLLFSPLLSTASSHLRHTATHRLPNNTPPHRGAAPPSPPEHLKTSCQLPLDSSKPFPFRPVLAGHIVSSPLRSRFCPSRAFQRVSVRT